MSSALHLFLSCAALAASCAALYRANRIAADIRKTAATIAAINKRWAGTEAADTRTGFERAVDGAIAAACPRQNPKKRPRDGGCVAD